MYGSRALSRIEAFDRVCCAVFDRHRVRWSVLSFLLALFLSLPPNWYPAEQVISDETNVLDGSFELALPARMLDGEFSSRDFVYSYGPAYQLLHGVPGLFGVRDSAELWRWKGFFSTVLLVVLLWLVVAGTHPPSFWRSWIVLIWCALFDLSFKPWGLILSMALLGQMVGRHASGQ
ncbi:hypothetical protein MK489_23410, partial [Myxococcota bacterium]|nr:hypothetical protein [Myxococcota bacterium]